MPSLFCCLLNSLRLIAECGLSWSDEMLSPHNHKYKIQNSDWTTVCSTYLYPTTRHTGIFGSLHCLFYVVEHIEVRSYPEDADTQYLDSVTPYGQRVFWFPELQYRYNVLLTDTRYNFMPQVCYSKLAWHMLVQHFRYTTASFVGSLE